MPTESYDSALRRLGLDPSNYKTVSEFQAALREKFGGHLTLGQRDAFTQTFRNTTIEFKKYGINRVEYTYAGKERLRYTLPGFRGLFGYVKAAQFALEQREQ